MNCLELPLVAGLYYLDFVTDVLVLLEYGCFMESELSTSCEGVDGCEPHWWWFSLALSILLISNLAQAFYYSDSPGLCCLSLLQLGYLRDLCGEDRADARRVRDAVAKLLGSAPQLYLQSYVLFVVGLHRNRLKLMSIIISGISLALGMTKVLAHYCAERLRYDQIILSLPQQLLIFFFLSTDQLLRAGAYAMVLSESVRHIGAPLLAIFGLSSFVMVSRAAGGEMCSPWLTGLVASHLVPVFSLLGFLIPQTSLEGNIEPVKRSAHDLAKRVYVYGSLWLRYLEIIIYIVIASQLAQRRCGFPATMEIYALLALLLANLSTLAALSCMRFEAEKSSSVVVVPVTR